MTLTDGNGNSITFSHTPDGKLQIDSYTIGGQTSNTPMKIGNLTGATSGLSVNALNEAILGGALTAATTIDASTNALTINGELKLGSIANLTAGQQNALVLDPSTGAIATAPIKPQQGSITASGGDVTGTLPTLNIGSKKVTTDKINDGAIGDTQISQISFSKITPSTVPAFVLGTASVASGDLTGTYAGPTLKPKIVDASKIADHTITAAQVNASSMITGVSINGGPVQYGNVNISTIPAQNIPNVISGNTTLTAAQSGQVFTYAGTTNVTVTLPASAAGLKYTFYVNGTGKLKIQAVAPNDPISIGGIKTDANCWIQNNTNEGEVILNCYIQHNWACGTLQGDWEFSGVS